MWKTVAAVVIVGLGGLAAFVASRPSDFRVTRSRALAAPPDVVHAHVNDLRKWAEWSPWERLDPGMTREHSGPPAGPGASYRWAGDRNVGEGRMTITESRPGQAITLRLEFVKPLAATNTTRFDLAPSGTGTAVTWTMTGRNSFVAKAFCLFMDMDRMIGSHFEQGLATLDAVTARAARGRPATMPAAAPAAAAAPTS